MKPDINILFQDSIQLLKALIGTPSYSREEQITAQLIEHFFQQKQIPVHRFLNNIWATNHAFDPVKPTLLLNSHHDTVKPNPAYTIDPFTPIEKEGKLFGLGSNDAGGALVSLIAVFLYYYEQKELPYNILFAATAEEEVSGKNGIEALLPQLPNINCGIVGEPTQMQMATAERGLLVLDVLATGKPGHAARNEGENALYKALKDIEWFSQYQFERVSGLLGPVKMSVTVIETENKAHNVVPDQCKFVVDIRINELYSFEEILETIQQHVSSIVVPRSVRIKSTAIPENHPLVVAGTRIGRKTYGSPTTSDKALMPFLTLKMGPGDSARSHSADEFIYLNEIKEGIELYIALLDQILQNQTV